MKKRLKILMLIVFLPVYFFGQQPERKSLRIADTLTAEEKATRNPILLRSEVDSLVKLFNIPQEPVQKPVEENKNDHSSLLLAGVLFIIMLLVSLMLMLYRHRQRINKLIAGRSIQAKEINLKDRKGKASTQVLENKIGDLHAEIHKLAKENEGLNRVISEYNGIQHDFDSLKLQMQKVYKVKNYPGYDKAGGDKRMITGVLETENTVAAYAYEKFVKPVLALTDRNKNNPAKISEEDSKRVLDLLISLSLLYIEYLYLRVNELSVGGKMVERIKGFSGGNGIDPLLLRKLNTDSGNRALVLRMVLDKAAISKLSYPVFDETNLNQQ